MDDALLIFYVFVIVFGLVWILGTVWFVWNEPEPIDAKIGVDPEQICDRCGSFTGKLEEVSLVSRGRVLSTWQVCITCRISLRLEDLLDLAFPPEDGTE